PSHRGRMAKYAVRWGSLCAGGRISFALHTKLLRSGIIALLHRILVCWRCPVDCGHERLDAARSAGQVPLRGQMPGLARGRPLAEWGALSPLLQRARSPAVHSSHAVCAMKRAPRNAIYRLDHFRHAMNPGKKARVRALLRVWREVAVL